MQLGSASPVSSSPSLPTFLPLRHSPLCHRPPPPKFAAAYLLLFPCACCGDVEALKKLCADLYMDRWSGILRVPLHPNSRTHHRVGASLCLSPGTRTLTVPSANAIFFCGDRVEGTGNPVIERLSNLQKLSEILVSKFGSFINTWVIEASVYNGPFAVFKDFIPSVNQYGEPRSYHPIGFPASTSAVSLLLNCLEEVKKVISGRQIEAHTGSTPSSRFSHPKTFILGFSKGGTVLNQLVTELGFTDIGSNVNSPHVEQAIDRKFSTREEMDIVPKTKESLLNSITEIHYVDVGLNSSGAYLTDPDVFERISKRLIQGAPQVGFVLHGTPRQWSDKRRYWIRDEKDKMLHLLESEAHKNGGKLQVHERYYFADKSPDMQMHFEVIESLDFKAPGMTKGGIRLEDDPMDDEVEENPIEWPAEN
ncbi:hypothetical protein RIF29_29858 [Crotalaria pallida]|uniref:Uncharacterized protein n=1 Tax=Crotalaria pallida TaxID=3830 RepID=A0AAN9EFA0_CROPI